MSRTVEVHVGADLDVIGDRFKDAWRRAEAGELTEANSEQHIYFEDFATLASVMTPKRIALLKHVHREPPRSIRALAQALGRDYRRVYDDVEALVEAGLLDRQPEGLRADYDEVTLETRISL